jgi:hypothetical protein
MYNIVLALGQSPSFQYGLFPIFRFPRLRIVLWNLSRVLAAPAWKRIHKRGDMCDSKANACVLVRVSNTAVHNRRFASPLE